MKATKLMAVVATFALVRSETSTQIADTKETAKLVSADTSSSSSTFDGIQSDKKKSLRTVDTTTARPAEERVLGLPQVAESSAMAEATLRGTVAEAIHMQAESVNPHLKGIAEELTQGMTQARIDELQRCAKRYYETHLFTSSDVIVQMANDVGGLTSKERQFVRSILTIMREQDAVNAGISAKRGVPGGVTLQQITDVVRGDRSVLETGEYLSIKKQYWDEFAKYEKHEAYTRFNKGLSVIKTFNEMKHHPTVKNKGRPAILRLYNNWKSTVGETVKAIDDHIKLGRGLNELQKAYEASNPGWLSSDLETFYFSVEQWLANHVIKDLEHWASEGKTLEDVRGLLKTHYPGLSESLVSDALDKLVRIVADRLVHLYLNLWFAQGRRPSYVYDMLEAKLGGWRAEYYKVYETSCKTAWDKVKKELDAYQQEGVEPNQVLKLLGLEGLDEAAREEHMYNGLYLEYDENWKKSKKNEGRRSSGDAGQVV